MHISTKSYIAFSILIFLCLMTFVNAEEVNSAPFIELAQTYIFSFEYSEDNVPKGYKELFDYFDDTGSNEYVMIDYDIGDKDPKKVIIAFRAKNSKLSKKIQLTNSKGTRSIRPKGLFFRESPHYAELLELREDGKYYRFAKSRRAIWLKRAMVDFDSEYKFTKEEIPKIKIKFFVPKKEYKNWHDFYGPFLRFQLLDNRNKIVWESEKFSNYKLRGRELNFYNEYGEFYLNDMFDPNLLRIRNSPFRLLMSIWYPKKILPPDGQGYLLAEASNLLVLDPINKPQILCPGETIASEIPLGPAITLEESEPLIMHIKKEEINLTDPEISIVSPIEVIPEPATLPILQDLIIHYSPDIIRPTPTKQVIPEMRTVCLDNLEQLETKPISPLDLLFPPEQPKPIIVSIKKTLSPKPTIIAGTIPLPSDTQKESVLQSIIVRPTTQSIPITITPTTEKLSEIQASYPDEIIENVETKPVVISSAPSSLTPLPQLIQIAPMSIDISKSELTPSIPISSLTAKDITPSRVCVAIPIAEFGQIAIQPIATNKKSPVPIQIESVPAMPIQTTPPVQPEPIIITTKQCDSVLFWTKVLNRNILFQEE
jgi:hypothetical protein